MVKKKYEVIWKNGINTYHALMQHATNRKWNETKRERNAKKKQF